MASYTTPLVGTVPTRKGQPQVGDLVTVEMVQDGGFVKLGARLERVASGTAFVKLVGLDLPKGHYRVGDRYPIPMERVVDWG